MHYNYLSFLFSLGSRGNGRGQFKDISAVTVAPSGDILVADSRIQVFNSKGDFVREIFPQGKGKGRYGGLVCDNHGFLLATRTEKARSFIQVCHLVPHLKVQYKAHCASKRKMNKTLNTETQLGLVADPVIEAIARPEFEDDLRTGVHHGGCFGP